MCREQKGIIRSISKVILLSFGVCIVLTTVAMSEPVQGTHNKNNQSNSQHNSDSKMTEGISDLLSDAEAGDAKAQYKLGLIYHEGKDVEQDYEEARKWFLKAAKQGEVNAQYNLGLMYNKGEGLYPIKSLAAKWFYKAADQGHTQAKNMIESVYPYGRGGVIMDEKDQVKRKIKRNLMLALQGNVDVQRDLGISYYYEQDYAEAVRLSWMAAEQGDMEAAMYLSIMYMNGDGVPEDQTLAFAWIYLNDFMNNEDADDSLVIARKVAEKLIEEGEKILNAF